jgi:hypothetical protein
MIDLSMTEKIKSLSPFYPCPKCEKEHAFSFLFPLYKCQECAVEIPIFDALQEVLKKYDSELIHSAFHTLRLYDLAPVYEGTIFDVSCKVHEIVDLNFNARELPENARILYLNITPVGTTSEGVVIPTLCLTNGRRSIDDLPHRILLYGRPEGFKKGIKGDESSKLSILIRWYPQDVTIIQEHLVRAAEAYWKNDIPRMIYNCFSAVELELTGLIEKYWSKVKKLNQSDLDKLFGRDSFDKKINTHFKIICNELKIDIDGEKEKIRLIADDLRLQRNSVTHEGKLRSDKESNKVKLYAATCWLLVLIKSLKVE